MNLIYGLRLLYFVAVSVGLVVNWLEYRHSRWVYRSLVKAQINGPRQMLANFLAREGALRVTVQVLLLVPAVIGLYVGAVFPSPPSPAPQLAGVAALSHITAVVLLTAKAFTVRHDRISLANAYNANIGEKL